MNIFQVLAITALVVYGLGVLYFLFGVGVFAIKRKRNPEVSLLVDVLARLVTVANVALFWPLYIRN